MVIASPNCPLGTPAALAAIIATSEPPATADGLALLP